MTRYQRCKKIIKQLKNGEWKGVLDPEQEKCFTLKRGEQTLWVGASSDHLRVYANYDLVDVFGSYWYRRFVWYYANRVRKATEENYKKSKYQEVCDMWDKENSKWNKITH